MIRFTISKLRDRPQFFDTVVHRIWEFSWRAEGYSLDHVARGLRDIVAATTFPFALVAHDGETYVGSSLGIASDLDGRPQYTPWVAAVWVESQYRNHTVGRSLVSHTAQICFEQGFKRVYLCARPARNDFYVRQGWVPIENGIGKHHLTVFIKDHR
jgi:GNAT superfamily N-acetyltransferase